MGDTRGHPAADNPGTLLLCDVGRAKNHRLSVWRFGPIDVVKIMHGYRDNQGVITLDRDDATALRDALTVFIDSCETP